MACERYILRNPHDINDGHAVNTSVQVIRASDGEQFLGMPLPDAFCIDKTPKPRKPKTDFDNNAAVKAAKAAFQRSIAERRIADGDIQMGGTGVEHGGDQSHTRSANASGPATSTPNEWPREDNTTDFDGDGNPVLWDEYGEPRLDQEGNRLYRDSTGMIVRKGITYDRKNKPVSPYGEGFIWKQGKTPYKGQTDGGEDGGEKVYVRDILMQEYAASQKMRLKTAVLPVAALTISRILNHPNVVSLIDIVDNSSKTGEVENSGIYNNITVWEDMTAGCLADLLPSVPAPEHPKWQKLVQYDPQRFSLPESLCWHVLGSVSRALLWLHYGVKETAGITDDFNSHDEDWMPILTRDVNPGNIFFKKPKGKETYGECKLGGFEYAKIASNKKVVLVPTPWNEVENEGVRVATEKKHYWPPEIFSNESTWGRPSEIWSLGAVIFCMMTGMPPPRISDYSWTISRMNDRGYSEGVRNIVAAMLSDRKGARPQANTVVGLVETGIRTWRAQTLDGRKYVDIRDEEIEEAMRGGGRSDESLFV